MRNSQQQNNTISCVCSAAALPDLEFGFPHEESIGLYLPNMPIATAQIRLDKYPTLLDTNNVFFSFDHWMVGINRIELISHLSLGCQWRILRCFFVFFQYPIFLSASAMKKTHTLL